MMSIAYNQYIIRNFV